MYLVGNPEDRFSHNGAQITKGQPTNRGYHTRDNFLPNVIIHLLSFKDWNHNFEVISSDEKHKLSVMFVKPEGLLVCIKLS